VYEFNRLVFGVNSLPFLAHSTMLSYIKKCYPRVAETILESTYMDDSMHAGIQ